jgi:hypothetical protein
MARLTAEIEGMQATVAGLRQEATRAQVCACRQVLLSVMAGDFGLQ